MSLNSFVTFLDELVSMSEHIRRVVHAEPGEGVKGALVLACKEVEPERLVKKNFYILKIIC